MKERKHSINSGILGRKAYNNGEKVIYLKEDDIIPDGYVKGSISRRTKEQIEEIANKSRETQKKRWLEKSEAEKQAWSEKLKLANSKISEEDKQKRIQKFKETYLNKSKEDLDEIRKKKSESMSKYWDSKSEEFKLNHANKVKLNGGGWNKKSIIETVQSKYGVENVSQIPEVRNKIENSLIKTTQEKYGYNHPFLVPSIRDKAKDAIEKIYGVRNPFHSYIIRKRAADTRFKRYGYRQGWNIDTMAKNNEIKYGFKWNCQLPQCNDALTRTGKDSKVNIEFAKQLEDNNIDFEREYSIKGYTFDFKIDETLVEINPFPTHNSTWGLYGNPKDINYHFNKTLLAKENNYRCIHIWDWDDKDKIIKSLVKRDTIYARQCIIKEVSNEDTSDFLNKYHYQNTCKEQKIRLGLYYNNTLIQIMTFGTPRYNKNYEYELLRLCTAFGIKVVGGSKKLFTHFINKYKPKSVISYCDNSKFNGQVYIDLGFKLKSYGKPTKHWYNHKIKSHVTDNLLRQRGFDQLFGNLFGKYGKGTSNSDLMLENGFIEIYDCGQSVYDYKDEN